MKQILIYIGTLCLVFLTLGGVPLCAAQTQFISLYNATNCGGTLLATDYVSGAYMLNGTNSSVAIRSARILGLWQVQVCPGNGTCNPVGIHHSYVSGGECNNGIQLNNGTIVFNMFGDAAMKDSSLIKLYPQNNLEGTAATIVTNSSNVGFGVKSYYFTGSGSSWMTYPGGNYTGTATCIGPASRVKGQGWGHTYVPSNNLNITSIKRVTSCPTVSGAGISLGNISCILVLALFARMFQCG